MYAEPLALALGAAETSEREDVLAINTSQVVCLNNDSPPVSCAISVRISKTNYECLLDTGAVKSMIDKSVRNTVELQYNSSNVAVLQTFDLLQEGVGMNINISNTSEL